VRNSIFTLAYPADSAEFIHHERYPRRSNRAYPVKTDTHYI
jgi:hypothetical protein